jgi:hypothetical protein
MDRTVADIRIDKYGDGDYLLFSNVQGRSISLGATSIGQALEQLARELKWRDDYGTA